MIVTLKLLVVVTLLFTAWATISGPVFLMLAAWTREHRHWSSITRLLLGVCYWSLVVAGYFGYLLYQHNYTGLAETLSLWQVALVATVPFAVLLLLTLLWLKYGHIGGW
ncbi:MAG: hypothetical protein HY080_16965 [Gammaproteobacteria bacterium]|nr:hypothetical protein [Gammaproteobacteria bacterium]